MIAQDALRNEPISQTLMHSDNPSWTALSTSNTSDEEDTFESQPTTPEPSDDKIAPRYTAAYPRPAFSTPSLYPLPAAHKQPNIGVLNNEQNPHLLSSYVITGPVMQLPPSLHTSSGSLQKLKRQLSESSNSSTNSSPEQAPSVKRTKIIPPHPHLHLVHNSVSAADATSAGLSSTPPSSPIFPVLRPQKPLPPITDSSSAEDWALVDNALHTQVASVRVLPSYARSPAPRAPDVVTFGREDWMYIPSSRFGDLGKGSKGKGRAQLGWTAPRWSNVGEFKARLDRMYGPGDINRGLGRGPKNAVAAFAEAGIAPDRAFLFGLRDLRPPQVAALAEDEDEPETSVGATRRGRLENPSPEREIRASRRDSPSRSPEIA